MAGHVRVAGVAVVAGCTLAFVAWAWRLRGEQAILLEASIPSIMGTQTTLKVVVGGRDEASGRRALQAAEEKLRHVESLMSTWVGSTELSRLNAAPPGEVVKLSGETLAVLRIAREFAERSQGAFDATCRPLMELWKRCAAEDREPEPDELEAAREQTGWRHFRLHEDGAERLAAGAGVDLGGIAKGYAVDLAVEAMRAAGARGGLVQCGGDLRVFGSAEDGGPWRIAIRDPAGGAGDVLPGTLVLSDQAVSTSGNYERYVTIRGRRRSHIVDPRSGETMEEVAQVTVIAADATTSDGWSTALTVLGAEGLRLLPQGVEACVIAGGEGDRAAVKTGGFERMLIGQGAEGD